LESEKNIQYFRDNPCQPCKGSGGDRQVCSSCGGAGAQIKTFGTGFMVQQVRMSCDGCGGRGYTLVHRCYYCDGRGTKSEINDVKIKLPHGIDDGQFLKLESFGDFVNGEYGDLVVQIVMTKIDSFEKINNDLIYNLFLGYDDLKKDKYSVPHPDGELNLSSPKQFDTSKPLRLKGKGYRGGDMYVKINVRFEKD
jgi:molecular chaperone DnaJ